MASHQGWPGMPPPLLSSERHADAGSDQDLTRPSSGSDLGGLRFPFKDPKAARYLMHFIHHLAPWVDICDPARHFATEVPRRMCQFPLLAFSMLAFASRQLSCKTGVPDPASDDYYANALRILIPLLDDPVQSVSENTLAGIVLLRLYEEFSDVDPGTHLLGSARILGMASTFAAQGGLGEAASWVVLRQNLYVSLANTANLSMDLDLYRTSSSFLGSHDGSFANRAVFLCSHVLSRTLCSERPLGLKEWQDLHDEARRWHESVPHTFRPYYTEDGSAGKASLFPTILLTRPAHVLGYQHFYLARILLSVFDPRHWQPGLKSFRARHAAEVCALSDLHSFIGLAISNPEVMTASFTAHHALHTCGCLLRDVDEQRQVLDFLRRVSQKTGWRVHKLTERLHDDWAL